MKEFWRSPSAKSFRVTFYVFAITACPALVLFAAFWDKTGPEVEAMVGSQNVAWVLVACALLWPTFPFIVAALPVFGLASWRLYRMAERDRVIVERERVKQERVRQEQERARQVESRQRQQERTMVRSAGEAVQKRARKAKYHRRIDAAKRREDEARNERINEVLRRDNVLDRVHYMSGLEFERFMANLFRKQGHAVRTTPGSGDQGTDLLLVVEGRKIAVQLKRWTAPVGNTAVQATFTGMFYYQAQEAWLITTSTFTKSAVAAAKKTGVRLVNGEELADWMKSLRDEP